MDAERNRKVTQADPGWRNGAGSENRQATQADPGWRNGAGAGNRQATQADPGWRNSAGTENRQATQADPGWRNGAGAENRQTAPADPGQRTSGTVQGSDMAGSLENLYRQIGELSDPGEVMKYATADYFTSFEEFRRAAEALRRLKTSAGNTYPVTGTLTITKDRTVLLLCSDPTGNEMVAKVYYNPLNGAGVSIESCAAVLEYMRTDAGKRYTLAVTEIGLVDFGGCGYYFELMPYCKDGDMSSKGCYSFDRLVDITAQMNEALHSIHQAGLLHRDVKPENIYEVDGTIKIGDFGIAKTITGGGSTIVEVVAGTEGYFAPETTRYIYSPKSDYYSLGVTLATLFEGHYVFENMNYKMRAMSQENERLPLSRTDPNREYLENLLNGLCKIKSKERFGYEEVKLWLADHNYVGGGLEDEWPRGFGICGETYYGNKDMFYGITKDPAHWEEAKVMLYSKILEGFLSFNTELAVFAKRIEEHYRKEDGDKGLAVFLKGLFPPGPIVWKGYTFQSLSELGGRMAVAKTPAAYSELLQNGCISHWLANTEGIVPDEDTIRLVDEMEALSIKEPEVACYWFGNSFAQKRTLEICGCTVSTMDELLQALFASPDAFYKKDGYRKLVSRKDGADLYGFLYSFGYREGIEREWAKLETCDAYEKLSVLMSMLDSIAERDGVNPKPVRSFYTEYGPVGIVSYTKKLVERNIYRALDADGRRVLQEISGFKVNPLKSVAELHLAYSSLFNSVNRLRAILIENPHCILAGLYEGKGVICTNLVGCFAFRFLDRIAPLGFHAWLESVEGGERQ